MRAIPFALVSALLVVVGASSADGARLSGVQDVNIPLPPVNSAKVVAVTVESGAAVTVAAVNTAQLGHTLNTQVIAVIKQPNAGTYRVAVFIHRFHGFQPMRKLAGASGPATTAAGASVQLRFTGPQTLKLLGYATYSCPQLKADGYFDDSWVPKKSAELINLILAMDSPPEEQVDNTVRAWCPRANPEGDDPGGS